MYVCVKVFPSHSSGGVYIPNARSRNVHMSGARLWKCRETDVLRDVKAHPEIILRALYAQRYVYRNTLILRMYVEIFKHNARAPALTRTYVWGSIDRV